MQPQSETLRQSVLEHGVLVVEDSDLQRHRVVSILTALSVGTVLEASNGMSALEIMQRPGKPPAMLVLDLEMPGMDGIELLQQIAQEGLRPSILVVSGADQAILNAVGTMAEALGLPLLGTLPKPASYVGLANMVARFREEHAIEHLSARGVSQPRRNAPCISLENLLTTLDERRIVPYYQPVISLKTGKVTGFEALARWVTPEGKLITPGAFISLAENNGLIDRLTLSMFDQLLADLSSWNSRGLYPNVSFNVSARSLINRDFANEILHRVDAANISPRSLIIEVTESALVSDLASAIGTLGRLRLKGFGLAIDDYGTGFSSMQQLSRLPFTSLKIDRSFVANAHRKWNLQTMLQSAIEMGHRLGLVTVAEGVETLEEMSLLESMGCQRVQGFLFSPAMPATAVQNWLRQDRARIRALCGAAI